jgi:LacI family transcriptional regulator/LacI family purine nucleotide synthesis repressor
MAKAVKLEDIALKTGVSVVTVSKALSGKKGVSDEMREKIRLLADELGYQQKAEKEVIRSDNTFQIGIIVQQRFLGKYASFYWTLYQQISAQASQCNCFSMLEVLTAQDIEECSIPKLIKEKMVEGIVVIGKPDKRYLDMLRSKSSVPLVFVDFYDDYGDGDFVISDSFYGAYALTNYLISLGHKNIAYVGTLLSTPSITDRYLGYVKSLMEHGLKAEPENIINDRKVDFNDEELAIALPKKMPTAFVCNSDRTAGILIKKLYEVGLRVPEDISVTGYDNFLDPVLCDVGITTYEVDTRQMAHVALKMLMKKMRRESYKKGIHIVEGKLVVKESVASVTFDI